MNTIRVLHYANIIRMIQKRNTPLMFIHEHDDFTSHKQTYKKHSPLTMFVGSYRRCNTRTHDTYLIQILVIAQKLKTHNKLLNEHTQEQISHQDFHH